MSTFNKMPHISNGDLYSDGSESSISVSRTPMQDPSSSIYTSPRPMKGQSLISEPRSHPMQDPSSISYVSRTQYPMQDPSSITVSRTHAHIPSSISVNRTQLLQDPSSISVSRTHAHLPSSISSNRTQEVQDPSSSISMSRTHTSRLPSSISVNRTQVKDPHLKTLFLPLYYFCCGLFILLMLFLS